VNQLSEEYVASIFRIEEQMKQETSVRKVGSRYLLFFDPEDGDDMFLRNVG
jgi:hypothetical protein